MSSDHRIVAGSCLDPSVGMPAFRGEFDHTITDPPYSAHVHGSAMRGASKWKGPIAERTDLGFVSLSPEVMVAAAGEIARLTRRWALVFSDTESAHLWREALASAGMEYVRTAFWHKVCGAPQFTGDRPAVACEAITVCHQPGKKRWNGGGRQGFYAVPVAVERPGRQQEDARVHTTQKPVALMEALIRDFTDEGDLIADPFAGSGTTLVAAKRTGRRGVGWELDPGYAVVAKKRIAGAREQLRMFEGVGA